MGVQVLYFAWLREKTGVDREELEIPEDVTTVAELMEWISQRGPEFEAAFAERDVVRAAIDQAHVQPNAPIAGAREIAFFPPVTGG